ncbi:tetratricopeptide repeat-containing sensor histidine kinase [Spongiimicrobium salis]|uniref:tetratricopeptide repeat-containing sensor histidine kinase n=1 Tax=Spongiimicrobium salis TaxID=1667022 RepID=UPI00374D4B1A
MSLNITCNNFFCCRIKGLFFLLIPVYFFLGSVQAQENEEEDLRSLVRKLEARKDFSTTDTVYINALNDLSLQFRFYNNDSLMLYAKKALKYSKAASFKQGEARSLFGFASYYSGEGGHEKAINYYNKSLQIAENKGPSSFSLIIRNGLSIEYAEIGDYTRALKTHLESIEIAKKLNDSVMLSVNYGNIAELYRSEKDYTRALTYYEKGKVISVGLDRDPGIAEAMSNIASVYADTGNYKEAIININKSITIFENYEIFDWLAYAYEVKGKIYLKQGKYKWALYWYNQCSLLHNNLDDKKAKVDLLNGMAEAYYGLEKDDLSLQYAMDANVLSQKVKLIEGQKMSAKILYKIYKKKGNHTQALAYHEVFQELSDELNEDDNKKSLDLLQAQIDFDQRQQEYIADNNKVLAKQRAYIYSAIVVLMILTVIIFITRRGRNVQKRLNTELNLQKQALEKRKTELKEINEVKNKLFSIIGHDLRGPIGALKGLLSLFNKSEIGKKEFMEFIPKLKHDVEYISFTLNNLLSWGQTQMKGAVTKPSVVALKSLVENNTNLLSEVAKNKSITIVNNLLENTLTWSDADQIDIVVRNLISNAIKFTPEGGSVTVDALDCNKHWEISIKDTGIGMDRDTTSKLFQKNVNLSTYGTNNEKGTGLGLSLCKEMVEKNKGTIWVESIQHQGSTFYFTLPKAKVTKSYKKIA